MDAKRLPFVLRLLPSFADFAFLMPIAFLFGRMNGVNTLLGDGDTGWHIRAGDWILAHGAVPVTDPFSYSKPGEPWFAWEWLSDVVLAMLNRLGGLEAVAIFGILMLSLTFSLLYRLVRRKANVIVAISFTMLAAAASSIHWLARPHLFTLLFLVLFYGALERVRGGNTRILGIPVLAVLPVAAIVWTNLHGGFVVGVALIGSYGIGEAVSMILAHDPAERARRWRMARGYLLCAVACMAASLVNPYSYGLHVHIAMYLRNPWNAQHIAEFVSPNFHHPTGVFFEAMMVLGGAAACWNVARRRFTEPVLLLIFAHAALLAGRNIPLFMIAAAPVVASAVQEWLGRMPHVELAAWLHAAAARFNRLAGAVAELESARRWHLISAVALTLVVLGICAPDPHKKFRAEFDPDRYPAAALAMLRPDPAARIFTNDEWGDYLIWSHYPQLRVFVDGRSDFYGNDFEDRYLDVLNVKHGWEQTLGRYRVDTVLLPPDAPLAGALKLSGAWRLVYDDGIALAFRSAGTAGETTSVTGNGDGIGRDREVTKTEQVIDRSHKPNRKHRSESL